MSRNGMGAREREEARFPSLILCGFPLFVLLLFAPRLDAEGKKGVMRGVELRKAPPPFSYFPAFSTAALFFPGAILFSSPFLPSPGFSQAEKEKLKDEARVLAKGKGGVKSEGGRLIPSKVAERLKCDEVS